MTEANKMYTIEQMKWEVEKLAHELVKAIEKIKELETGKELNKWNETSRRSYRVQKIIDICYSDITVISDTVV